MPGTINLTPNQKLFTILGMAVFWFVVLGPSMIGYGVYSNRVDGASLKWPMTTGRIVNYDKTYRGGKNPGYNYTATYAYSVNGMHYTEQRYAVWSDYVEGGGWSDFMDVHPVSSSIEVYYDPNDPKSAVLAPGPNYWVNRNLIWMGTVFIVLAIVLIIVMRKIPRDWGADRKS